MKELNSVVLDGVIIKCTANESSTDIIIQSDEKGFKAVGYGNVGIYIQQNYKFCRGIRIVGKLDIGNEEMYISIEHVEFKPIGA